MKMANKFYITTPIYYVNDVPHIGHAYTSIAADVLARYHRMLGDKVFFLTGTDEHGAKIAEAAQDAKKEPQKFVDELALRFKELLKTLNISNNEFIRTTNPKHEENVKKIIEKLQKNGYIEKRKYQGWYCVGCEKYLLADELVDGLCPDHKKEPVLQSEDNYFFLLSKAVADFDLYKLIEKDKLIIKPIERKNEILGKINAGLEDISISRENVKWGIKFPGDESQTIYVWIDALINYFTATKIYENGPIWPADLHLIGKDILWFHSIIWPAILLAIGEKPPQEVFAHGYFKIDGQKMSKSIGNVIDPNKISEKYGADTLRYSLLREFPFGEDGDISEEKIAARYQTDLSNDLGNLVQRTLTMINKYNLKFKYKELVCSGDSCVGKHIEILEFDKALEKLWSCIRAQNKLIEDEKPWVLASSDPKKLKEVLEKVYNFLCTLSIQIEPFMPEFATKLKKQLVSLKPEPLFPRLD